MTVIVKKSAKHLDKGVVNMTAGMVEDYKRFMPPDTDGRKEMNKKFSESFVEKIYFFQIPTNARYSRLQQNWQPPPHRDSQISDLGLWGTRDIADRGARGVRGVSKTSASITDPVHDISDAPEL